MLQNILDKFIKNNKFNGLFFLTIAAFILLSILSYDYIDDSINVVNINNVIYLNNWLGKMGANFGDFSYQLFGYAIYLLPIILLSWSILFFCDIFVSYKKLRFLTILLNISLLSIILYDFRIYFSEDWLYFDNVIVVLFHKLNINYITQYIGDNLNKIIIYLSFILLLIFNLAIPINYYISSLKKLVIFLSGLIFNLLKLLVNISRINNLIRYVFAGKPFYPEAETSNMSSRYNNVENNIQGYDNSADLIEEYQALKKNQNSLIKNLFSKTSNKLKKDKNNKNIQANKPLKSSNKSILPPINLLESSDNNENYLLSKKELQEKSDKLLKTLNDFGVRGKMLDVKQGPVITMFLFEPSAGTKSSRVIGLGDDIARSLSEISARIAVIEGQNALGIELPNKKRAFFRLKELITSAEFQNSSILLPMVLGKDLAGHTTIVDLAKMPHLLVAGTTGSGKSVAINTMIMSLLYRYTHEECKMIMIDPKMLELSAYDNIPHLITPVVTEPSKAAAALKWAVKEMENRYRLMSQLNVRNIHNYNEKITNAIKNNSVLERHMQTGFDNETGKPIYETTEIELKKMPFIVVIVDEMADLMLVAGKDIEGSIQRLAQMARAAGIHIIMATQRPSVDVITGVIKANFPSRISFKVTSKIDSRTIIGEAGAQQLLGMGDMLFMGNSKIVRLHGPFVSDDEVNKVTNFLRNNATPEYISDVTNIDDNMVDSFDPNSNMTNNNGNDEVYNQALEIVKRDKKASISYIQRCLRIGYNRAANIVEQMEKNGVLSEPNSSGKREILID